jgi:hypothetical protein
VSAVFGPVPDVVDTFRILAGGIAPVGWIRLSRRKQMRWIARGVGSERFAAPVREFCDKAAAVAWPIKREPDPRQPGERTPRASLKQQKELVA